MVNPYSYSTGKYFHDENGFFPPSYFGFPEIVDTNLKMSMFPLCDIVTPETEKHRLRKIILQMPEIEKMMRGGDAIGFASLYRSIVWSTSIGSPPIDESTREYRYTLDASIFKHGTEIESSRQWIQKYFVGQLVNTFLHLFYTEKYHSNDGHPTLYAGVNYFIDVTEGTLLDEEFSVLEVLDIVREAFITYSLVEEEENKTNSSEFFKYIIERFYQMIPILLSGYDKKINPAVYKEKLWMIFIFIAIKLFQQKDKEYIEKEYGGIHHEDIDYDYKLRFYLVKRRGRFVHRDTETIIPAEMYAPKEEENISDSVWLSMSQYYRLLTLVQRPFTLPVIATYILPLQCFVFRDAHACTSTSISTQYDNIFYERAYSQKEENDVKNIAMFGINPMYKRKRHARIGSEGKNRSWIQPVWKADTNILSPYSFGILAGVCWFFNENIENSLFDERYYNILLIPFNPLNGVEPYFYNAGERANIMTSMPNFFTYGVDEYILSTLVTNAFRNEDLWNGINFLFFTIHFIRDYCGSGRFSSYEYYPLTASFLARQVPKRGRSFGRFARKHFVDEGLKYIFINTMFGNIDNRDYVVANTKDVVKFPSDEEYATAYRLFWDLIPSAFSKTIGANGIPTSIHMSYLLDQLHRYDRPVYWVSQGRKWENGSYRSIFAPRIIPEDKENDYLLNGNNGPLLNGNNGENNGNNGENNGNNGENNGNNGDDECEGDENLIVPNNRSKYPSRDIGFVINNKLYDLSCILGSDCPENIDTDIMWKCVDDSDRGWSTWGGSKKKTRKGKKKTRKIKNKKRRQTQKTKNKKRRQTRRK